MCQGNAIIPSRSETPMRIGIFSGPAGKLFNVQEAIVDARAAQEAGFPSYWLPQMPMGIDALTSLSHIGVAVPEIELGTAVIPTYPRHPIVMAQQALSVTSIIGDRLALGIGLSHKRVIEKQYGYQFDKPVRHLREYLEVLNPQLREEPVRVDGETLSARNPAMGLNAPVPQVLVAALGPQMLRLTGRMADGTITWMTGNRTLAELTVPEISGAASEAGRPKPRVLVGLPVLCTDDIDAGMERASKVWQMYGTLPSYRAMLDREGLAGPEDIAIVGNESEIADRLQATIDAGADDIIVAEFAGNPDERLRTREALAALL
jgi:5,10-methylenetetrahydromethanopterin reductase